MAIKINSRITLQWRLLGGFLFSALITGFSVLIGLWSLRQIQSDMNVTTGDIGKHIDYQNSIISQLMPLRSLVASVSIAKNSEELKEKEKQIKSLRESWKNLTNKEQVNIIDDLEKLYQHKHRHLKALRDLFELRKSNVVALVEVTRVAHTILNDPKFDSAAQINESIAGIRSHFDQMSSANDTAFGIVKTSLSLRYLCADLNIAIKDALLSRDSAVVGYLETEILTLLDNIGSSVKTLPDSETTLKLAETLGEVKITAFRALERKKESFRIPGNSFSEAGFDEFRKTGDALFREVGNFVMRIADDAEFESFLKMEEASAKIRSDLDQTSLTSDSAVAVIKAAMSLRFYCNELNAKVKDALMATNIESVDIAKTEISGLLSGTRKELSELPKDENTRKIAETLDALGPLTEKMFEAVKQVLTANDALNGTSDKIREHLADVDVKVISVATEMKSKANRTLEDNTRLVERWQKIHFGIFFGALILAIVVGFWTSEKMNKIIRSITGGMSDSINQVASASGQVSSVNHLLVEGASQQAVSIGKTSEAVNDLLALTRQNEDTANRVNDMMRKTSEVVEQSAISMSELTHSIQEISSASSETRKIIHTIDEIAFQTRLLSLNASIEAARAGETGLGFAVVADEVRNLAMRSAEAAKITAALIENIIGKIREQRESVEKTDKHFSQVAQSIGGVDELVRDIITAFDKQASGIELISGSVREVEDVIRQNTTHAEKSVSVFEELNRHTERMLSYIRILRGLEEKKFFQRYIRIPHSITGRFYHDKGYESFVTKNMSVGGVLITTDHPLEIGTVGKTEFDVENRLPLLTAQVIRQSSPADNGKYGFALRFANIGSKTRKAISDMFSSFPHSPESEKAIS